MKLSALNDLMNGRLSPAAFSTQIKNEVSYFARSIKNNEMNLPIKVTDQIHWVITKGEVLAVLQLFIENKLSGDTLEYAIHCIEKSETTSYSEEIGDTLPLLLVAGTTTKNRIRRIITLLKGL